MISPTTPQDLVNHLDALAAKVEAVNSQLYDAEVDSTRKHAEASHAEDVAYLKAEGSVETRKCTARISTWSQQLEADLAEIKVRALSRDQRLLMARIDIGRTYSANLRAELSVLQSTQGVR